jgi:hypothetical protein
MSMRMPVWMLPLVLAFCTARADDRIWSGVVLVTNEPQAAKTPRALEPFAETIRKVTGGNSLCLLGKKKRDVRPGSDEWLVPCRRIYLKASVSDSDGFSYRMAIDFYEGNKLLLTAEVRLARDAPLFIRGPRWGNGRIVVILDVR